MKRLLAALAFVAFSSVAYAENKLEPLAGFLTKTADFTVATGILQLGGWTVRETAGSTATFIIRDAADTDTGTGGVQCNASGGSTQVGGKPIAFVNLSANETAGDTFTWPLNAPNGVCVDVTSGSIDFNAYIVH